jgi:hypothetical protein
MATEKKIENQENTIAHTDIDATPDEPRIKKVTPDQLRAWRLVVPVVLAFIFAGAAVAVVSNTTNSIQAHNYSGSEAAQAVQKDFTLNEAGSETVYQQQVTAQWAIKDMVQVVADQTGGLSAMSTDLMKVQSSLLTLMGLIAGLLLIIVGMLATLGFNLVYLSKKK